MRNSRDRADLAAWIPLWIHLTVLGMWPKIDNDTSTLAQTPPLLMRLLYFSAPISPNSGVASVRIHHDNLVADVLGEIWDEHQETIKLRWPKSIRGNLTLIHLVLSPSLIYLSCSNAPQTKPVEDTDAIFQAMQDYKDEDRRVLRPTSKVVPLCTGLLQGHIHFVLRVREVSESPPLKLNVVQEGPWLA